MVSPCHPELLSWAVCHQVGNGATEQGDPSRACYEHNLYDCFEATEAGNGFCCEEISCVLAGSGLLAGSGKPAGVAEQLERVTQQLPFACLGFPLT